MVVLSTIVQNRIGRWWRQLNQRFLLLFGLSVINLLFMHGQLAMTVEYEYPFKSDAILSNVFSCLIDATFFFLLSMLLTRCRVKGALLMTFILTALLSFCNVLYSRFFGHYLPNLAILQMGNLNDNDVMGSVLTGFRWLDIYYVLMAVVFGWLYKCIDQVKLKTRWLRTLGCLWGVMLAAILTFILMLVAFHDPSPDISFIRFNPIKIQYTQAPNNMLFRSGFVRRALMCHEDFIRKNLQLEKSQKEAIKREYTDYKQRTTTATVKGTKNLIFIIVESYMAVTSDLTVNGKEITPFLNRLKRDSTVYYNGHVRPNINIGESSDGQFIYMAGLMPLKSEITVNIVKDKTVCGLPAVMKEQGRIKASQIVVPTSPTFWEQDKMNGLFGFDTMYSKFDCDKALHGNEDLNDEQIFTLAARADGKVEQPFFSLILTMSMHNPYTKCVEHGFQLADETLTAEYRNYLTDCHYTDQQLERYFGELKRQGLYDNSVIVITADHDAHPVHLNMEEGQVSDELPLYIVHGGIDKDSVWTGPCNQLDVYTTLLDMFGITTPWRGLGHSLLNAHYTNSVSEKTQTLSEWIVRSNYFSRYRSAR
jgi:lipoteichoic acid synthase